MNAFIQEAEAIIAEVKTSFGHLSASQLNYKPSSQTWSVGQCLHHLVTSNSTYFPIFDKIIRREQQITLWERMPLLPNLFGKMLIRSLSPASTQKLKAPQVFRPANSDIDASIIEDFAQQQQRLIETVRASEGLGRTIITSPASGLVTYSLYDAYNIILVHERRHVLQAQRVMKTPGFPL